MDDDDAIAIQEAVAIVHEIEVETWDRVERAICRYWMFQVGNVPDQFVATCVGCGCTDREACAGGCSWLALNEEPHRAAFEAEQRVQAFRESVDFCESLALGEA